MMGPTVRRIGKQGQLCFKGCDCLCRRIREPTQENGLDYDDAK
jgi:hypothetical protein